MDLPNAVNDRIDRTLGPCWIWRGATNPRGYGNITYKKRTYKAHRFIYECLVGPIPEGLTLDHLCRNTLCVNPEHLEPCTMAENIRRGSKATATHCQRGHEFTPDNTIRTSEGRRKCRQCHNESQRSRYQPKPRKPPRTHCKNGHEFTPENTMHLKDGSRRCRVCFNDYHSRYYHAHK